MKSEQDLKSQKDGIAIAAATGIAVVLFVAFADISLLWRVIIILELIMAFAAGMLGSYRKIGFTTAFIIGLIIPVLGFVFALSSTKLQEEAYREKMLEIAENKTDGSSVADQLFRLNELRKEGVITDDEFAAQKEKLLSA